MARAVSARHAVFLSPDQTRIMDMRALEAVKCQLKPSEPGDAAFNAQVIQAINAAGIRLGAQASARTLSMNDPQRYAELDHSILIAQADSFTSRFDQRPRPPYQPNTKDNAPDERRLRSASKTTFASSLSSS